MHPTTTICSVKRQGMKSSFIYTGKCATCVNRAFLKMYAERTFNAW